MLNITTKISRNEMIIAKRADPRRKDLHWRSKEKGRIMMGSIMQRMDKLISAMCSRAYRRFGHYTDRAMSLEDLVATVKENLVLSVYRFKRTGKYEPYYYLMGVINVVLRNVHNWRNRKKRVPPAAWASQASDYTWKCPISTCGRMNSKSKCQCGMSIIIDRVVGIVSIDTPTQRHGVSSSDSVSLVESISSGVEDQPMIPKNEVLKIFDLIKDEWLVIKEVQGAKMISIADVIEMILEGRASKSIAKEFGVSSLIMRKAIREQIVRKLRTTI